MYIFIPNIFLTTLKMNKRQRVYPWGVHQLKKMSEMRMPEKRTIVNQLCVPQYKVNV